MSVYLDSSAIVKLVLREAESSALRKYLRTEPQRVSCALARVEVVRAVRRQGATVVSRARTQLGRLDLVAIDDKLLDHAADIGEDAILRSLDAIHLAAASTVSSELTALITYDARMLRAAEALGLPTVSPGASRS
jgi:predicted nucleic acid-binding protein